MLRKTLTLTCVTALPLAAPQAEPYTADLAAPHLDVLPRSAEERTRIAAVTAPPQGFDAAEPFEARPGGAASGRARTTPDAFSQPSANIPFERELDFKIGNGLFKKLWVSSPASTLASDGLGQLYNARSCQRCHLKDGRGHPPEGPDDDTVSRFLRLSVPAVPDEAMSEIEAFLLSIGEDAPRSRPDPIYGGQLQDFVIQGHAAEGRMRVEYEEFKVVLSDGETARLRRPSYAIEDPGHGAPHPGLMLSPSVAPSMIELGLLEAIPAEDILASADLEDRDAEGISGRAQIVWSFEFDRPMLGRFGWKAGAPTLGEQSASAFAGDIGISSPIFDAPFGDCTEGQPACRAAPHGDGDARETEIDAEALDLVTFYSRNLAPPMPPEAEDPRVLRGKRVFHETGCATCHQPKHVTHRLAVSLSRASS